MDLPGWGGGSKRRNRHTYIWEHFSGSFFKVFLPSEISNAASWFLSVTRTVALRCGEHRARRWGSGGEKAGAVPSFWGPLCHDHSFQSAPPTPLSSPSFNIGLPQNLLLGSPLSMERDSPQGFCSRVCACKDFQIYILNSAPLAY